SGGFSRAASAASRASRAKLASVQKKERKKAAQPIPNPKTAPSVSPPHAAPFPSYPHRRLLPAASHAADPHSHPRRRVSDPPGMLAAMSSSPILAPPPRPRAPGQWPCCRVASTCYLAFSSLRDAPRPSLPRPTDGLHEIDGVGLTLAFLHALDGIWKSLRR
ncbi:unnamed protein product, partial [Urochloa humidicola]